MILGNEDPNLQIRECSRSTGVCQTLIGDGKEVEVFKRSFDVTSGIVDGCLWWFWKSK